MKIDRELQISAVIVFCLIAAGISGYVNERDYRKEWCAQIEKMKTETIAPAVRSELAERCK
ncbi:MAG: hypothetical protein IPM37_23265 [Hahellaceae bacterium]|nr:hypothetical protein [Hahellaceae bacterium]